jgi:hypothetical protein
MVPGRLNQDSAQAGKEVVSKGNGREERKEVERDHWYN